MIRKLRPVSEGQSTISLEASDRAGNSGDVRLNEKLEEVHHGVK